jgi:hypothetical protein
MAGTSASSPFIKEENDDFFGSHSNQRFMAGNQQGFGSNHQNFGQFSSHGGSIDPSTLTMGANGVAMPNGGYGSSYGAGNYTQASIPNTSFSKNNTTSTFADDELLEDLGNDPFSNQTGNGQDFGNGMDYGQYNTNTHNGNTGLSVDPTHINGYSNTPDGDPIASPFVHGFQYPQQGFPLRQVHQSYGSLHSPGFPGSPLSAGPGLFSGSVDSAGLSKRPGLPPGRKSATASSKNILQTRGTPPVSSLHVGSADNSNFSSQPIRTPHTHRHQKTLSGQWDTPSSLTSFPGSDFSPISGVHPNAQISDILKSGSMPTKLSQPGSAPALQSQEMKRRRRRESHNLVERRRRDNINERIQELSHLVPMHRLEDEKVRKALQNNSPLSPTLAGLSAPPSGMSPPQATSGLAGPGARRATAGNITTGIPIEEKDKGPNKGDILNGAVSWTRDLMWMLHTKLQQQAELAQILADNGLEFPFEETEDEKRMHTELMDAMFKNDGSKFHYSRAPGSGLRVPKHTDVKGDPIGGSNQLDNSLSPENHSTGDAGQAGGAGQYWSGHNSGGSGAGSVSFKEEDEYGMDLTQ